MGEMKQNNLEHHEEPHGPEEPPISYGKYSIYTT